MLKNYKILQTIGVGYSCKVKLAIDIVTEKNVAIKIMNR